MHETEYTEDDTGGISKSRAFFEGQTLPKQ